MASSTQAAHYWRSPKRLSEVPDHLCKLLKDKEVSSPLLSLSFFLFFFSFFFFLMQEVPTFPGVRMFIEPTWLPTLIYKTKIEACELVKSWGLGRLLVVGNHIRKIQFYWESLGALIELWHPQTHTFVFPSFEATILLEEVEILLGLRSSVDYDIACHLGDFHILDVFGEFMSEKEIRMVATPNGMDLFLFSS